jgi:hypothetical protein
MDNITRLLNTSERIEVWKMLSGEIAVAFRDCNIKDGDFLVSEFGTGKTFEEAVNNYIEKISGKRLVFHAFSDSRYEAVVL